MTKGSWPYGFPPWLGEHVQRRYRHWRRERHPHAAEVTEDEQQYVYRWFDYDPELWYPDPDAKSSLRFPPGQMQRIKEGLLEVMDEWVAAEGNKTRLTALKRRKFGHRGS